MSKSILLVFLILSLITSLFPAKSVSAQSFSTIQGVLTRDRRFVTIKPSSPRQSLHVMMRFDPQDQQDLRNHSGFFLLNENNLRSVYAGGSPIYNNIAAGTLDIYGPTNELHATVSEASGEYTVVIYNDTDIPMTFQLSVENGRFPMETNEPQQPIAAPVESVAPSSVDTREISIDEVLNEVYVVESGDSLSLISIKLYGDFQYYSQLCTYNRIDNCNLINVGESIRTPSLAVLTNAAPPAPVAVATAVSTPVSVVANSGETYTVVAGDTLAQIAAQIFGDFQRYRDICSLNNLPNCSIISVGQVLRIPNGSVAGGQDGSVPVVVQPQPAAPTPVPTPVAAPAPLPTTRPTPVSGQATPIAQPVVVSPTARPTVAEPAAIPTLQPAGAKPTSPVETGGTDITSLLEKSSDKSVFLLMWNTAGMANVMKGPGPLTFFVPHDAAFVLALQSNLKSWMENKQLLSQVLSYHVVAKSFDPSSVANEPVILTTLAGTTIKVERMSGGLLTINGARVIGSPISASNGTIYTIDQVLTPPQ